MSTIRSFKLNMKKKKKPVLNYWWTQKKTFGKASQVPEANAPYANLKG